MRLNLQPILPSFYNSDTDAPFDHCLVCNTELIESQSEYLIEKAMRHVKALSVKEVMFEYAICMECAGDFRDKLSSDSAKAIGTYYQEHLGGFITHSEDAELEQQLETCMLKGKALADCNEYVLNAHCVGDKMLVSFFPYMISDVALDEIAALLSAETLDELDNFKNEHFNGPPELAEVLNPSRLILV